MLNNHIEFLFGYGAGSQRYCMKKLRLTNFAFGCSLLVVAAFAAARLEVLAREAE